MKAKLFAGILFLCTMGKAIPQDHQVKATQDTRTFELVKKMIGGAWKGSVGSLEVSTQYRMNANGTAVDGEGQVGDPTKPILRMRSSMGYDGATGKVYYLDSHNGDTVYFGECSVDASGDLKIDFTAIAGAKGHWVSTSHFTNADTIESTLFEVKADGKLAQVHTMTLKRSR